jgi:gentisate 1,2-dioxygenase
MAAHISDFQVGTYKKAHRHGPGAHVIILQGQGYSLLWKEGEPRQRVDWGPGSMFAPPEWWFHQHFNTGKQPARYLALRRGGSPEHKMVVGMNGGEEADGPDQIEYEQEDPAIYEEFVAELKKNGADNRQPRPVYAPKARA